MSERFVYTSKEALADAMAWSGCPQEEINEALNRFTKPYYDRQAKEYITSEEYERRNNENH